MLVYDELILREPGLYVPGRMPVGPVRVDTSHPLAPTYLFHVNQPHGYTAKNLVDGTDAVEDYGANVAPHGWRFLHGRWGKEISNADDGAFLTPNFTIYAFYAEALKLENNHTGEVITTSTSNYTSILGLGAVTGYLYLERITIMNGDGRTGFTTKDSVIDIYALNRFLWVWNGSYYDLWWNGVKRDVVSGDKGHASLITGPIGLQVKEASDNIWGPIAAWDRPVNGEELALDPYGFLTPA